MIEEGENRFRSEGAERELVDEAALLLGQKMEQQAKGVPIAEPGVRAQVALGSEILGEKPLHESRKIVRGIMCATAHVDGSAGTCRPRRAANADRW